MVVARARWVETLVLPRRFEMVGARLSQHLHAPEPQIHLRTDRL